MPRMPAHRVKFVQIDRWFARGANAISFWTILPAGVLAAVSAYLSTGVSWISAMGAWGWFMSGLVAFVLSALGFATIARTRLWRLEAKDRARIQGDSTPFDAMAKVYQDKRLYLRDLAPLGRRQVIGKTFINCEIIGPGTAVLGLRSSEHKQFPVFRDCLTFDVDCIQIDPNIESALAIAFPDCDFENCRFYHMTLLFTVRLNNTLNWITPDFRQSPLIDTTEGKS